MDELIKRLRNAAQCADKGFIITPSVCLEAADAIERLQYYNVFWQEAAKMAHEHEPKWIPVEERLPENIDEEVLVCTEDYGKSDLGFVTVAIYDGSDWLECWERKTYLTAVTHWMPLPQPPEEE